MESAQSRTVIAGAVQIQPVQVSRAMAGDGLKPGFLAEQQQKRSTRQQKLGVVGYRKLSVTKDVSDKRILVDMILWAVENHAPANYLLISGDGDFSNAIHQLRMRKYNILLAQPVCASPALAAAATNVWKWTTLAAGGLPFRTNTIHQNYIPTPISKPISANQHAFSNAHANTNNNATASRAQSLSNPGFYSDTKTKAIYIPKNSNQLTMTSMSGKPTIVEETSRGDLCGSMNKGDLDLYLQLPEHIQSLIRVIFNSLNTLRLEKILPTKENLGYCMRYSKPEYRHTDVTIALNIALEQQIILKLGLVNFELYVGKTSRIWKCVNPLGGNPNHYKDATWNAIEKFLCSTVGHSAIAVSECRYEAALILRNACLKNLTLGEVLQILNMIINLKGWIKTHSEWQPITITLPATNN